MQNKKYDAEENPSLKAMIEALIFGICHLDLF
jgi:hypothetical protein